MISVTEVQKAYLAYFGRPADPVGLAYWMNSDTAAMRAGFAASAEYATLYSGMTSEQRVEQIYQNLLGRASDAAGKAYWVAEFNAGRETVSSLVVSMQTNALGVDIGTIDNRVTYAILFTAQLDTPAEVVDYSGTAVADRARTDMAAVTYTDASLATARANITSNSVTVLGEEASPAPTPDTTAPTMSSAVVAANGLSIVVTYSEALTGTAELGDYAVTLGSGGTAVTGATISGNTVTLTVSNAITDVAVVTGVVYTATEGTANSIKDAASNSAATQTLAQASITNGSGVSVDDGLTFTLTTANDTFAGGAGDDTFNGVFTNGGTNTFNSADNLTGGGNTGIGDTLTIGQSIAATAITLDDTFWGTITGIENLVFTDTTDGVQTFTFGDNFNTAFAAGVALTTDSTAGAINITLGGTVNQTVTLTTTSTGGVQTIDTGTGAGLVTVDAISTTGGMDISGTDVTSVTTNSTGGNQIINVTGVGAAVVTVDATSTSGTQAITTGAGNDNVTSASSAGIANTIITGLGGDTIVAGLGNETITAGAGTDDITTGTGTDSVIYATTNASIIGFADVGAVTTALVPGEADTFTATEVIRDLTTGDTLTLGNAACIADVDGTLADDEFMIIQGTYAGNVFTVGAGLNTGNDSLLLWDDSAAGGMTQSAVVLVGVTSVEEGNIVNGAGVLSIFGA